MVVVLPMLNIVQKFENNSGFVLLSNKKVRGMTRELAAPRRSTQEST